MRFYLTADSDLKAVENYIKGYKRKNDGFYCDITAVKDKRSLAQNAIWWTLVSAVGRAMGEFKESASVIVKKAYIKENNLNEWIDTHKLEVAKMSQEVGHKNIVILPFAHLSNNLAKVKEGIKAITLIEEKLKENYNVIRAHFGSHKSLLLDIYGHPGNARYREFY